MSRKTLPSRKLWKLAAYFLQSYWGAKSSQHLIRRVSRFSFISTALSVSALIIVMSVMRDLNTKVRGRLLRYEPHLVLQTDTSHWSQQGPLRDWLSQHGREVKEFFFFRSFDALVYSWKGDFLPVQIIESSLSSPLPNSLMNDSSSPLSSPALLPGEKSSAPTGWLGRELAQTLGVLPGERISLLPTFQLLRSVESTTQWQGLEVLDWISWAQSEWDKAALLIAEESGQVLWPEVPRFYYAYIWLHQAESNEAFKQVLKREFPAWQVTSWQERHGNMLFALRLEKSLIAIFLSMAFLVSAFSVFMSLALFMAQKSKDFILFRLLGLSYLQSRSLSHHMTFLFSALAVLVGVLLGSLLSLYLQWYPLDILPDIYYDTAIAAQLDWGITALISILGIVLLWFLTKRLLQFFPDENLAQEMRK
jgi:lipoprotein-releasing system permease protein